jgi:hypothetical protein
MVKKFYAKVLINVFTLHFSLFTFILIRPGFVRSSCALCSLIVRSSFALRSLLERIGCVITANKTRTMDNDEYC